MRILVINWQDITNPFSGGAEVHLFEIFKRISLMGHRITLLCSKTKGLPQYEIVDGIEVTRIGNRSLFNWCVPFFYKKLEREKNFDIVVDDINKVPFFTPLFVKKPIVGILHHFFGTSIFRQVNPVSGFYVYFFERLMDLFYKKVPFVVVSESTRDELLQRGYSQKLIDIVYNALDHSKFPFKVSKKYAEPTVTYFGRLKKYKSIEHLFFAFKTVVSSIPEARLFIVGRGDYERFLKSLSIKLGIQANVTFWGFVDEPKKIQILSSSHCVVNTSIKEGWGITNLESNACGTPVISANVPGLRDSVKEGVSGLLYTYGNIAELTEKILMLLLNSNLRQELELGAISWAKKFSWDFSSEKMLKILENNIKNNKNF